MLYGFAYQIADKTELTLLVSYWFEISPAAVDGILHTLVLVVAYLLIFFVFCESVVFRYRFGVL